MSESEEKTSNVSRRGMLKWAGALAAVGVVGVGLGFGADILTRPSTKSTTTQTQATTATATQTQTVTHPATQTVTQPAVIQTVTVSATSVQQPTTLSYVPPLSASVQSNVDKIVGDLIARGNGELVYRVTPALQPTNLIKVHIKNGVFTRAEPDWGDIHSTTPIEDAAATSKAELISGNFQPRGAQMSYAIQAGIYAPDRVLYPMQRTSTSARGDPNGSFTRITWQQALDTIAAEITKVGNTYGLYSIYTAGVSPSSLSWWAPSLPNDTSTNLLRYTGHGVATWGHDSGGNEDIAGWQLHGQPGGQFLGELGNVLNSKFIVFWGNDPAETGGIPWQSTAYYFMLAHEQGTPTIYIGPRECMTAEILADQWIPIRAGTDITMMLAVANVLFKENLYDKAFVAKYVEPTGFAKWQAYVLGQTAGFDGAIDRTPEWAAPICGVPAPTIKAFAELYGKFQGHANGNPAWLMFSSGAARKYGGENPTRAAAYLQWMTGNVGISGGNLSYCHYSEYEFNSGHTGITMNYNRTAPESIPPPPGEPSAGAAQYLSPCLIKEWKWPDAVLLRPQVASGQLSLAAYNQIIGSAATNPAPNLKFVMIFGSTAAPFTMTGTPPIGKAIQAIKQLDMYVWGGWHWTADAHVADIVLPFADFFETEGGFSALNEALGIAMCPKLLNPQGEAMPMEWVRSELANRLGFGQYYNGLYGPNGTIDKWDSVDQQALQNGFNAWSTTATSNAWGITLPTTLAALRAKGFLLAPSQTVTTGNNNNLGVMLKKAVDTGDQIWGGVQGKPFWTPSGLAEFYSNYFADPNLPNTKWGGKVAPMAMYETQRYGMFDANASTQYPLMLGDTHPRARSNVGSCDSNPLAGQDEIFRHSVWISVADAQARGIKDNDSVTVFNEQGTIVLPAYVTSRIVPGHVQIFAGAWYTPDSAGVDRRGSDVVLMHDDYAPMMEPWNTRVEIKKS